ncbi:MAG: DUF5312 family protein [Spirochaetota bacterium]
MPITGRETGVALTVDEDKVLRRAIRDSLSLDAADDEQLFEATFDATQRRELIEQAIEAMSGRERARFRLYRLKAGADAASAYESFRLQVCRERIQAAHEALAQYDGQTLPGKSGELFAPVIRALESIRPLYMRLWETDHMITSAVHYLLVSRGTNLRAGLSEFMSQREMQELYLKEQSKARIRDIILERYAAHLNEVDPDELNTLEEGLRPLYYLYPLVKIDFSAFCEQFGMDRHGQITQSLRQVRVASVARELRELFYALYLVRKLPEAGRVHPEIIEYMFSSKASPEHETVTGPHIDAASVQSTINTVIREARVLADTLPLADLIRVYHEDPFYRLQAYVPRIRLMPFYRAHLKRTILEDLDRRFGDVRMGVIGYVINELFNGQLADLKYYGVWHNPKELKIGLPSFQYQMAMRCLMSYLNGHYRQRLQEELRIVSKILPARRREDQGKLIQHSAALQDVGEKINEFDVGFSPEQPDGQYLYRTRQVLEKDLSQQKAFRNLQAQKHREIRLMLHAALEHLEAIEMVLRDVGKLKSTNLEDRYRNFDPWSPRPISLEDMIEVETQRLRMLRGLLNEAIALDEGY